MIKGKAKLEFGNGDIRLTPVMISGVGALCCVTQDLEDIDSYRQFKSLYGDLIVQDAVNNSEVILTFSNVESVDILIAMLKRVRMFMDDSKPLQNIKVDILSGQLSFDDFLKEEVLTDNE